MNANAVPAYRKKTIIGGCLTKEAKTWFQTVGNVNWEQFKQRFLRKFTTGQMKARWRAELEGRKKLPTESVATYYQALITLWEDIGNNAGLPDEEKKEKFIRGLSPQMIVTVMQQQPADLAAAVEAAKRMETALAVGGQLESSNTNQILLTLVEQVKAISKTQEEAKKVYYTQPQNQPQNRGGWQPRNNRSSSGGYNSGGYNQSDQRRPDPGRRSNNQKISGKCWNCEKIGHMSKDCRSPRRERRPDETQRCSTCQGYGHSGKDCPTPKKAPKNE
jgi:hypothetical protein